MSCSILSKFDTFFDIYYLFCKYFYRYIFFLQNKKNFSVLYLGTYLNGLMILLVY